MFSELIKNFDKTREYMRDFYIYGFKVRGQYTYKSARTYDNERRRIESWLVDYMSFSYTAKGKRIFLSMDSTKMSENPLYQAWKSKSFTDRDITLHFFILDILQTGTYHAAQITDRLASDYGAVFDIQTVRAKLQEYETLGLIVRQKDGKTCLYQYKEDALLQDIAFPKLMDAVCFYTEAAPFGFVGSTLLEREEKKNDVFWFKDHFMVHTLEDGILAELLQAMRNGQTVSFYNDSRRSHKRTKMQGIPLKILVSLSSSRRYLCLYLQDKRRFTNVRLDSVNNVSLLEEKTDTEELNHSLERNLPKCWGVCFGERTREELLILKLAIHEETESFLLERLSNKKRNAELLHIGRDLYLYSMVLFDANEAMSWVKKLTGHIVSLECTNKEVVARFYEDMRRMECYYLEEDG